MYETLILKVSSSVILLILMPFIINEPKFNNKPMKWFRTLLKCFENLSFFAENAGAEQSLVKEKLRKQGISSILVMRVL